MNLTVPIPKSKAYIQTLCTHEEMELNLDDLLSKFHQKCCRNVGKNADDHCPVLDWKTAEPFGLGSILKSHKSNPDFKQVKI